MGKVVIDARYIEELIGRVALSNRPAFSELYDQTSAKLFGVVLRVCGNRAEAEDVLQESYIKIWQSASRYAVNGLSPMTWLITIARNTAIDRIRARRQMSDIDDELGLMDTGPTPEAAAIAGSERKRIDACLEQLDPDRAKAVCGAYIEGYSYEELASHHSVPLNTMRTWLRRSLQSLRECLS